MALLFKSILLFTIFADFVLVARGQTLEESKWSKKEREFASLVKTIAGKIFSTDQLLKLGEHLAAKKVPGIPQEISEDCSKDVENTLIEFVAAETWSNISNSWAVQMLDSLAKPPSGIMAGNLNWLGNYQQCLDVSAPSRNSAREKFIGEYCLVEVNPKKQQLLDNGPIYLRIGMCFPSTCSMKDKSNLMSYMFKPVSSYVQITVMKQFCQTKRKSSMDTFSIVVICIISTLVVFVLMATLADMKTYWTKDSKRVDTSEQPAERLLASFSAIKSLKAIFHIDAKSDDLCAIDGIRALSIIWIICGHHVLTVLFPFPWKNPKDVDGYFDYIFLQPLFFPFTYSVTNYFVISGFLATFNFIDRSSARQKSPNIFKHLLHRYLRVTFPLLFVLLFLSGPFYYLGDGPIWPILQQIYVRSCRRDWWKLMLHIQNIGISGESGMLEAWYLSADTQLFCFTAIILYQLYRKPLLGLLLMATVFVVSTFWTMFHISANNYQIFLGRNININAVLMYANRVYCQTHHHISSYIIGMAAGFLYYVIRTKRIILSKNITIPCWIASVSIHVAIIFGTYPYAKESKSMGQWENLMYGTLGRPAWALGVSWIILACGLGYGGILNWFLSRPIFRVMGRLAYCIYLTHVAVLTYYFFGQKEGVHISMFNLIGITLSNAILSCIAAIIVAVLAEKPIINVLKQFKAPQDPTIKVKKYM